MQNCGERGSASISESAGRAKNKGQAKNALRTTWGAVTEGVRGCLVTLFESTSRVWKYHICHGILMIIRVQAHASCTVTTHTSVHTNTHLQGLNT